MKKYFMAAALALVLGVAAFAPPAGAQAQPYNENFITITPTQAAALQLKIIQYAIKGVPITSAADTGISLSMAQNLATANKTNIKTYHVAFINAVKANPGLTVTAAMATTYKYKDLAQITAAKTNIASALGLTSAAFIGTVTPTLTGVMGNPALTAGYTANQLTARTKILDAMFPKVSTFGNIIYQ